MITITQMVQVGENLFLFGVISFGFMLGRLIFKKLNGDILSNKKDKKDKK